MTQTRGPVDGRRFATARMHRNGPSAQRVLLVGDRTLVDGSGEGPGAAFADRIADGIAERSGRGLDLDVVGDLGPALQAVGAATQAWRLWRYEAVVVVVRESQLQAADRWWSGRIPRIVRRVIPELAIASRVLLVRLRSAADGMDDDAWSADRPAGRLVSSLAIPVDDDGAVRGMPRYAHEIADRVAGLLRASEDRAGRGGGGTARERRALPESEEDRQHAVDRATAALGGLTPDLERVVLLARNTFDVPFAQVNLLDHGRIRTLAFVGTTGDGAEEPICTIAVRGSGPTVIGDTWQDPRLNANPHVHGDHPVRFYAAHPIESIDGYRIGTLCVFDFVPHDPGDIDLAVLRDLALLAEAEISVLP